ncbi:PIG-L family deacetylase [Phycicoccus duodecadis]|uniref:N-acetyl-1-D-myo-inositol-2-amino-2-deoxy-alpha-D-glucopyranoside deacetylase n=1 Tax=Phycicoccus duodecadis TaxID=173053 RepID=A0A2N3YH87_9MICO|nr:PIG-L family deacetylase [Phycicoccus duodecadis]PKW26194.1 N-acetyl-1-D-myo-inositol-2-amino-2-deoxy-alpha-D-glucopyranoside deacetylase [Phycicoccus duodecadis]
MRGLLDGLVSAGTPARLLFVHAHPDDETLTTGVALAHHVARGDDVHVLTCTLGEEGEVIPPALAHLEGDGPALAAHRRGELAAAVAALGVTHHLLGAAGPHDAPAFRDSGMAGSAAAADPRAFAGVPLAVAAEAVGAVLDAVDPHVVVTYDAGGGYGHPDHVRTHEATRLAAASRGVPVLGVLVPLSWATQDREWLARSVPEGEGWVLPTAEHAYAANVVPDEVATRAVVDPSVVPVQEGALRAHATQVVLGAGWYALSNHHVFRLAGREAYALLDPDTGRPLPEGRP